MSPATSLRHMMNPVLTQLREVRFAPLATMPTFGGPDISVTTDTRLTMSFEGAVPLPVVVSDVSIPITSLLTILHGADCRVRRLNVSTPAGDSADVYGHIVDLTAPRERADGPFPHYSSL